MAKRAAERYLPEHLHEALLADERVGEQDLQLRVQAHRIRVIGTVSTQARRDAITTVIAELAPGWTIRNDVEVIDVAASPDVEDIT